MPLNDVPPSAPEASLRAFLAAHERLFVLTGAGCSTASGIPDYRDEQGAWKRQPPVMYRDFMSDQAVRQRYWARSFVGWRQFSAALPNDAHRALARLGAQGRIELLLTQNVDGLHQAAGSREVVDLHGRLAQVRCMACDRRTPRAELQQRLLDLNPQWAQRTAAAAPDGDAALEAADFAGFAVADCASCGGVLKPDVVFYGESVPPERVASAMHHLQRASAMLVVGSSLMVYSGYRFVQAAAQAALPIVAVNLGRTRAEELLNFRVTAPCDAALGYLLRDS